MKTDIMITSISNQELQAAFSALGAETMSLRDARSGREFLWQGDEHWWGGRSPILFPITGGLWDGVSRIGNQLYRIPKHGFASHREWRVVKQTAESVMFALTPERGDAEIYPYDYEMRVSYTLVGRALQADFEVENRGTTTMYFQIGGHPGIVLPDWKEEHEVDGYLQLEGNPLSLLRAGVQGCIEVTDKATDGLCRYPVPLDKDGLVPLSVETFADEALIFDQQISGVKVLDRSQRPLVRVTSGAPVWLFWSQQGRHCPYVCAEPWYGLPDVQGYVGDIAGRLYIQQVMEGETWHGGYCVEVLQ